MGEEKEKETGAEQAAAKDGCREGLRTSSLPEAEAAALLLTAEAMLQANPDLEAAKCARAEVRIWDMGSALVLWS